MMFNNDSSIFYCFLIIVPQPGDDVSDPGSLNLFDTFCSDKLIKKNIGYRADQRQVLFFLTDGFVCWRDYDRLRKRLFKSFRISYDVVGGGWLWKNQPSCSYY